jgi:hypothetical protein
MTDMQDISVLHDVVLALEPKLAFGAGIGFGACFQ